MACTHHNVKAKNKLPGPPFIRPLPICTYNAVPTMQQGAMLASFRNNQQFIRPTDGSTNANQLDMTTLQLPVGVVADLSYRSNDAGLARMSAIKGLFFVNMRALDLILAEVATRGGHGG